MSGLENPASEWAMERFYHIRMGHCRTGQYLKSAKNANTADCGWCYYKTQAREHLLKNRKRWGTQQKIAWAEVWRETGRGKNRFKIRDLLAGKWCTR